jgi:hypothetical protein
VVPAGGLVFGNSFMAGHEARADAASACQAGPSPVLDTETCAWLARTFPAGP